MKNITFYFSTWKLTTKQMGKIHFPIALAALKNIEYDILVD